MNTRNFYSSFLGVVWLFAWCGACQAATITVPNLAAANVQTAINAAVTGDVIVLPAGSATWTSPVTIDNKALTIVGAGIGATNITADPLVTSGTIFKIQSCGSKLVDVSGITWIGNKGGAALAVGKNVSDINTNYRLHHMYFTVNRRGILLVGKCEGVVDHCTFRCTLNAAAQGITVWGDAQYVLVPGNTLKSFPAGTAWTAAAVFGDSHRAFIEDCAFNFDYPNDAAVEGYYGAKYCVRHCTITNSLVGNHGLDSGVNSTHSYEVYDNVSTYTAYPAGGAPGYNGKTFEARGGTGLYYNNKLVVPWLNGPSGGQFGGHMISLECNRAVGFGVAGHDANGGFVTGSNPYDGNQSGKISASGVDSCGWPALESIGTTGPVTLYGDHSACTLSPFYEWDNTYGVDLDKQVRDSKVEVVLGPNYARPRASGTNLVINGSDHTKVTSATRNFVMPSKASPFTTIGSGSNGLTLPQANISVASTTGFSASGVGNNILVNTSAGIQAVKCTGVSGGNTFTGCRGGTGTMSTGGTVGLEDTLTSDAHSWIHITAGTGFTPGWYQIVRCESNAAILDRSPGTAGSTGGTWSEEVTNIFPSDIIKENRDYFRNTAKPNYTPYNYPHPLVNGVASSATPSAPANLKVVN